MLRTMPLWALIYNHYVRLKGLSAPNVKVFAEAVRPEGGVATTGATAAVSTKAVRGPLACTDASPRARRQPRRQ